MKSSYNEEAKFFLMANHEEDVVTSYFFYNDLFQTCKNINKETGKLNHLVSTYKTIIFFIELENKNLLEVIESIKERHNVLIQNYSSSYKVLAESTKCDQCDVLKSKNDDL